MMLRRAAAILGIVAIAAAGCGTSTTASTADNSPPAITLPTTVPPISPTQQAASPSAPATTATTTTAPIATANPPVTTPAPQPKPPATVNPPSLSPAGVVTAYFAAINARDYARAWALGGMNLGQSYAQFADGFAGTAQDSVAIEGVSGGSVAINLTATSTDGTQQQFTGTYNVSGQEITGASVSQVQPAGGGLCGAPQNPYGYNLCGNGNRIDNPPQDICNYFDCIDNFWNGNGYMVECNDGTYSMSGGIEDVCSDHNGEGPAVSDGS
jgi:hypothetical protein